MAAGITYIDDDSAAFMEVTYVRVKRVAYFSEMIDDYEDLYDEGPYDFALLEE